MVTEQEITEALKNVTEVDLKKDIISLDLVSNIKIEGNKVSFDVKVSNPAMHSRKRMEEACIFTIQRFISKDLEVLVNVSGIDHKNSDPSLRKVLPGVKNMIAIASGKGGVGKSTITSNLAVGLAKKGFKVGLIDADIYGPSMPIMFDVANERPRSIEIDGKTLIKPIENYGVKILSIGFFAELNEAIVWRGPMASKAIDQMIKDANWGELDYLLIDLPPGTGDIHLTIVQTIPLTGAIIVSTPQNIALADARKGVDMFQLESVNVPIIGVIENMSYFVPPDLPDKKYYIFGKDGVKDMCATLNMNFLGEIPIVQSIREAADIGSPAVLQENTPTSIAFDMLTSNLLENINEKSYTL